jgi:hypothetical protein
MGSVSSMAIASDLTLTLEQQIGWHLHSNHFPPVPSSMIQPCIDAIDAYWEGNLQKMISLPEGVGYKGLTVAPAIAIIEQHHLDAWLVDEDIDYEDQ